MIPYLIDVDYADMPAPLRQFQAVKADEEGTRILVAALNKRLLADGIPPTMLGQTFEKWWPDIKDELCEAQNTGRREASKRRLEIIETPADRTRRIVEDLGKAVDDCKIGQGPTAIRYSGFLSAFAIGEEPDDDAEKPIWLDLLEEKTRLIKLAERGVSIRCIISPPAKGEVINDRREYALKRLRTLKAFLEKEQPAHRSIQWALCTFRQKNTYIIGDAAFYEGFKKGLSAGYDFTLRQATPDAIRINTLLFDALFEHSKADTLMQFKSAGADEVEPLPNPRQPNDFLRQVTLARIKRAIDDL